jgi:hypothetical protein
MKNPIQNNNSKFSKRSKETAIAPREIDTEINKPDKQPVLTIKDPSVIKDPSTSKTPISDPSHSGDTKQPLSEDKGSSLAKLPDGSKPVIGDGEKNKDSGLYGSKQLTTGDKQESAGAAGAQLGVTSGADLPLVGSSLGLAEQLGGAGHPLKGSSADAQLGGADHLLLRAGTQPGITSGAIPAIVRVAVTSVQVTGGGAALAAAGGFSTGSEPFMENPLYRYAQTALSGDNQKSFDRSDDLLGNNSTGTLDSLTNYGLSDPSSGQTTLTLEPSGDGALTNLNPPLNPPSSFTYVPNLGESTGTIAPLTGIGSSGGTILLPDGLLSSISAINGANSGAFNLPFG